jgi:hypothetical protein
MNASNSPAKTAAVAVAVLFYVGACGSSSADDTNVAPTGDAAAADAGTTGDAASSDAAATGDSSLTQDTSSPPGDATSSVCGAITDLGVCQGTLLKWCAADGKKLDQEDCKDYFGKEQAGVCIEVDDQQGHFCAAKVGDPCLSELDDGNLSGVADYCGGKAPGCVYGLSAAVCKENLFSCTVKDVATCKDNYAIWDCNVPQPTVTDCTAFKAKCGVKGGVAVCTDVAAGSECDDYDVFCAAGLTCKGADDTNWGTCTK